MSDCYKDNHTLIRDGRSQADRLIENLLPESVQIDGRSMQDILEFLSKYARQVIYQDTNGELGDWTGFFEEIIPIQIALISRFDLQGLRTRYEATAQENPTNTQLNLQLDQVAAIFSDLENWRKGLKDDDSLGRILRNLIQSDLRHSLRAFTGIVHAAAGITTYQARESYFSYQHTWGLNFSDLSGVNTTITRQKGTKAQKAALKASLDEIFQTLYKALQALIRLAPNSLEESLKNTDRHAPHFALLIAFLRLLDYVRGDLNAMTGNHLDFFYREVLQLKEKAAVPDKAHLLFELAKKIEPPIKIEEGTRFKDGKDANGTEIQFALDQEVIVDKAQVADLKTLFFQSKKKNENEVALEQAVYIAPIANSADGKGAGFTTQEVHSWPTLGAINNKLAAPYDKAQFALAFASEVLFLKEGERVITVTLSCDKDVNSLPLSAFTAYLSSEKAWIMKALEPHNAPDADNTTFQFQINLNAEDEAVTAYDGEALEDAALLTAFPVLKLLLNEDNASLYFQLQDIVINQVTISAEVSETRNANARNDDGIQDINNSFLPFTAMPRAGSNFFIDSEEIFSKELSQLSLNVEWERAPSDINSIYDFYINGGRSTAAYKIQENIALFSIDNINFTNLVSNSNLQLTLQKIGTSEDPFLIDEYPKALARQAAAAGNLWQFIDNVLYRKNSTIKLGRNMGSSEVRSTWSPELPSPPYIPTIKSFSIDYTANANADALQIFHLHPYEKTYKAEGTNSKFLPDFRYKIGETGDVAVEGNLFIGLENLQAGGQLNLLFQIAEGSANPDAEKAKAHWQYLADNKWTPLIPDVDVLSDTTNGLIQSGIVKFAIPWGINKNNTVLSPNLHWLRATTQGGTDAIGETISVHAQAGQVTFAPQANNDLQRLDQALAAESISKPVVRIAAVKKVQQPYPSFGGRAAESTQQFYVRVSEHLRHKGRAITLFDYERLVLEAFPEVYKVKCIPHTMGRRGKGIDHTLAPGYVTLVVVPDVSNLSFANQLEPKLSLARLEAIEAFLRKHASPFARIKVLNPRYEGINVSFQAIFHAGKSEAFYEKELEKSIQAFLTPWASEGAASIIFGGKIFKSTIINHIENQDYVDYIKDFKMTREEPLAEDSTNGLDEIAGKTARSVLNAGVILINPSQSIAANFDFQLQNQFIIQTPNPFGDLIIP